MAINRLITSWNDVPIIMDLPFAARITGKSYDRLEKLCQMGDFPAFKVGAEWRIEKQQLMAYTEGRWNPSGKNQCDTVTIQQHSKEGTTL